MSKHRPASKPCSNCFSSRSVLRCCPPLCRHRVHNCIPASCCRWSEQPSMPPPLPLQLLCLGVMVHPRTHNSHQMGQTKPAVDGQCTPHRSLVETGGMQLSNSRLLLLLIGGEDVSLQPGSSRHRPPPRGTHVCCCITNNTRFLLPITGEQVAAALSWLENNSSTRNV